MILNHPSLQPSWINSGYGPDNDDENDNNNKDNNVINYPPNSDEGVDAFLNNHF